MQDHPDARYVTGFISRPQRQPKRKNIDEDYYPSSSDTYAESFKSSHEESFSTPSDAPTDISTDGLASPREQKVSARTVSTNGTAKSSRAKRFDKELLDEEQTEQQSDEQGSLPSQTRFSFSRLTRRWPCFESIPRWPFSTPLFSKRNPLGS